MRKSHLASADGIALSGAGENRTVTIRAALAVLLATTALAGPVFAQQPVVAQQAATDDAETGLAATVDDVVVTARKREEQAQDVPLPLTVISGKKLEEERVTNIRDLTQQLPNISFSVLNPRNTSFAIRGLGSGIANDGLENAVGFFVDGVYYARPSSWTFDFLDLERVELLRGPQGTLFGKNTAAGALSITTAKPSFTPSLTAEASFGDYGYRQFRTRVTGPVDETLALSLAASVTDRDGFLDNVNASGANGKDLNDYNNVSLRGQALWLPSDDFSLRVIADYGTQDLDCCTGIIYGRTPNGTWGQTAALTGYSAVIDPNGNDVDIDSEQHLSIRQRGLSAEANYEFSSGFTLTSITAVRDWDFNPKNDSDVLGLPIITQLGYVSEQNQFSQELRLSSPTDQPVEYVAGLYYFRQNLSSDYTQSHGSAATAYFAPALIAFSPALSAALNGTSLFQYSDITTDSYAAFTQATWHITDRLDLTGGLRYTYEVKEADFRQTIDSGVPLAAFPLAAQPFVAGLRNAVLGSADAFNADISDGGLSGTINLGYKVTDNALLYAFYSRGFKSSGVNFQPTFKLPTGTSNVVEPEKVDDYEIGVKSDWFNRRLQVNLGAYWTEVTDAQQQRYDATILSNYIANVGEVRARGVELEIQAAPIEGLRLTASGSYNDAAYVYFPNSTPYPERPGVPADLSGKQISGAPRWQAYLGGDYSHSLGEIGPKEVIGYVGGDYSYTGSYFSGGHSSYLRVPAFDIVNLRLGLRAADRAWDLSVWSKNALDENYVVLLGALPGSSGLIFAPQVGDPRTIGTTLRVNF